MNPKGEKSSTSLNPTHFGIFVIFAAIYAAGTLALGRLPIGDVQIKPGEIAVPLAALFGMASIIGLVFGQFIANMASPLGPLDLITPAIAFVGLLALRYLGKRSILAGLGAYYVISSAWLTILTSIVTSKSDTFVTAFVSQGIALVVGMSVYFAIKPRVV